jgi:hypothetical protein
MHVRVWREKARELRIQRIFVKFVNALKFANDLPWPPSPSCAAQGHTPSLHTGSRLLEYQGTEISIFPLLSGHMWVLFLDTRLYLPPSNAPNVCEYASMLVG